MHPFQQGGLDGLCGIYSVVNATRLAVWPLKRIDETACEELFAELAGVVDAEDRLLQVLTNGSCYPVLSRLLGRTSQWLEKAYGLRLRYGKPFHNRPQARTTTVLARIAVHLTLPRTSAIVSLTGSDDHWTVVQGVTRRGLILFDSNRRQRPVYCRLRRDAGANPKPVPRLVPRDVFLIACDRGKAD